MKKTLVLILALLLCMQCIPALAGLGEYVSFSDNYHFDGDAYMEMMDEGNTVVYTHPTFGYSITVPKSWIIVDRNNVNSIIYACQTGEISIPGMNTQNFINNASSILQKDSALFIDSNGNILEIVSQDYGQVITDSMFENQMVPSILNQYATQLPGVRLLIKGNASMYGSNRFYTFTMEVPTNKGIRRLHQYIRLDGTYMHCLTLTANANDQLTLDAFITQVEYGCSTFINGR